MNLIKTSQIFRPISAFTYSIEWQKRGLPHMHLLLWLSTPIHPDEIDNLIRAEIPGDRDPELQQLVLDHMVYRPCGDAGTPGPVHERPAMLKGISQGPLPKRHKWEMTATLNIADEAQKMVGLRSPVGQTWETLCSTAWPSR